MSEHGSQPPALPGVVAVAVFGHSENPRQSRGLSSNNTYIYVL
jgi:hypothetical protein